MNKLVINDRVYKIAVRLNMKQNSFNGADASCTFMSGIRDLVFLELKT